VARAAITPRTVTDCAHTSRAAALAVLALLLGACASTPRVSAPDGGAPRSLTGAGSTRLSSPATDPRSAMIANALGQLGQPYQYGGAAPGGFDCSGLVFYAAAGAGVQVPRTASEQRRWGTAAARNELEPGDLIFMHLSGKKHLSREELHVGIALGGSRFIHAPASGGRVRIDSIAAAPYAQAFIAARRIIGQGLAGGTL